MPTTSDAPTGPAAGSAPAGGSAPDRTRVPPLSELDPVPLTGTAARPATRPYGGGWDDGVRPPTARPVGPDPGVGPGPAVGPPADPARPVGPDASAGQQPQDPETGGYRVREPPAGGTRGTDGPGGTVRRAGTPPLDRARADGAGRAALVVAVLGLVASFLFFPLGLLVDVVALWLAARALGLARRTGAVRGRAGTAIGFGVAGVVLALVEIAVVLTFRTEIGGYIRCEQSAGTSSGQAACTRQLQDAIAERMGVPAP